MKVTTIKQGHKTSPLALSMTSACDPDISKLLVQRDVGGSRGSWSGSRSNPVYSNFLTCHVTSKYNHHFVWREGARSGHSQHTCTMHLLCISLHIDGIFLPLPTGIHNEREQWSCFSVHSEKLVPKSRKSLSVFAVPLTCSRNQTLGMGGGGQLFSLLLKS